MEDRGGKRVRIETATIVADMDDNLLDEPPPGGTDSQRTHGRESSYQLSGSVQLTTWLNETSSPLEPLWPDEPLTIGFSEAEDDALFHRVTAAALLPGGTFVVADGSRTMRTFASDGAHLHTHGRAGAGPGEFAGIARRGTPRL